MQHILRRLIAAAAKMERCPWPLYVQLQVLQLRTLCSRYSTLPIIMSTRMAIGRREQWEDGS